MSTRILLLTAAMLSIAVPSLFAQSYTFSLVECNDLTAFPQGMNSSTGVIVGSAHNIDSALNSGFIYAGDTCGSTHFGTRGADFFGITNNDEVIGTLGLQKVIIAKGTATPLPDYPGAFSSFFFQKNKQGVLAGNYYQSSESSYGIGFLYRNGTFTSLPGSTQQQDTLYGLNDDGIAVGTLYSLGISGFVLKNQKLTYYEYPGARFTYFRGINNHNVVVGNYYIQKTGQVGIFTYDLNSETWTDLNFPPEYAVSTPIGISDTGVIALLYSAPGGLLIATPASN